MEHLKGVYLPLITPFKDGEVDVASLRRLVEHYAGTGISGYVLLGTTGESPTVEPREQRVVVEEALDVLAGRVPVYVGAGGNSTRAAVGVVTGFEDLDVAGYLSVVPYYNRPSVPGMIEHFRAVAGATDRPVIVYNVPYRTGANLPNEALLEIVATTETVRAVKDSTGNITQSLDLLRRAPAELSVLTGEDALFLTSLANGAAGGILASAHLATRTFVEVAEAIAADELSRARAAWHGVSGIIGDLFVEANPMPLKYCLWKAGLIDSPECRLPLTGVSAALASRLDDIVTQFAP